VRKLSLISAAAMALGCANVAGAQSPSSKLAGGDQLDPPSCPAEQLSCGLQKPVLSNGVRAFVNEEMALRATFPAGSRVCLSRSGDAPRGFYAWYGTSEAGCPERGDIPASFMGLSAHWNAAFARSAEQAADPCRPLSGRVKRLLQGAALAIPGHRSLACARDGPEGRVEVTVYALGGPADPDEGVPGVVYFAVLGSTPERLEQDLVRFRQFLRLVRVGVR
jgi:hypothetical protein